MTWVEAANIRLGSENKTKSVLKDLHGRTRNWLRTAVKDMANIVKTVDQEWRDYAN